MKREPVKRVYLPPYFQTMAEQHAKVRLRVEGVAKSDTRYKKLFEKYVHQFLTEAVKESLIAEVGK